MEDLYLSNVGSFNFGVAVMAIVQHSALPLHSRETPFSLRGTAEKYGFKNAKSVKRRFFKLNGTSLRYYKSEKAATPKGVITLSEYCLAVACERGTKRNYNATNTVKLEKGRPKVARVERNFGIALLVPEVNRTYYIHFTNSEHRNTWLSAISNNIELLRMKEGVTKSMIDKLLLLPKGKYDDVAIAKAKIALRNRFKPRIVSNETDDPLMLAFQFLLLGNAQSLSHLCRSRPDVLSRQTDNGMTLLIKAAQLNRLDIVHWLLAQNGVDVDAQTNEGETALIAASRFNYISCCRALLDAGASPFLENSFGESALSETKPSFTQVRELLNTSLEARTDEEQRKRLKERDFAARGDGTYQTELPEAGKAGGGRDTTLLSSGEGPRDGKKRKKGSTHVNLINVSRDFQQVVIHHLHGTKRLDATSSRAMLKTSWDSLMQAEQMIYEARGLQPPQRRESSTLIGPERKVTLSKQLVANLPASELSGVDRLIASMPPPSVGEQGDGSLNSFADSELETWTRRGTLTSSKSKATLLAKNAPNSSDDEDDASMT